MSQAILTQQPAPKTALSLQVLEAQNRRFNGSKGVSKENRAEGFRPAFADRFTGEIYLSRFADGRLAPMHLLDGLPGALVVSRSKSGRVTAIKESIQAGFVRDGKFYTREQACAASRCD